MSPPSDGFQPGNTGIIQVRPPAFPRQLYLPRSVCALLSKVRRLRWQNSPPLLSIAADWLILAANSGQRHAALETLRHPLSAHALAVRAPVRAERLAEGRRRYGAECKTYIDHCAVLWMALHEGTAQEFIAALEHLGGSIDAQASSLRHQPVGTSQDRFGGRRRFPEASNLDDGLRQLWQFLRDERNCSFIRAVVAHYMLCALHPFADGNGRVARIIFSIIANEGNPMKPHIPLRLLFNASSYGYEIRLHLVDQEADWTELIKFFCHVLIAFGKAHDRSLLIAPSAI